MKKLIIVRHGKSGDDDHLSPEGIEDIRNLAYDLREEIAGASVLLLTSPTNRAEESMDIISEALGENYEKCEILWSESKHPMNCPGLLALVKSRQGEAEVMILVTHLEYGRSFPDYFAVQYLNTAFGKRPIEKGEALIIDCEEKTAFLSLGNKAFFQDLIRLATFKSEPFLFVPAPTCR